MPQSRSPSSGLTRQAQLTTPERAQSALRFTRILASESRYLGLILLYALCIVIDVVASMSIADIGCPSLLGFADSVHVSRTGSLAVSSDNSSTVFSQEGAALPCAVSTLLAFRPLNRRSAGSSSRIAQRFSRRFGSAEVTSPVDWLTRDDIHDASVSRARSSA
jgi:hypothetical protein